MKCWNCDAKQGFLCGGKCYICQGEIPPQRNISHEESAAVFCKYHWETVSDFKQLLHEISEIFGIEIKVGRTKDFIEQGGFEDTKNKFQKAYQKLKEDAKLWEEIYDEEMTKVKTKLRQWIEKVNQRVK